MLYYQNCSFAKNNNSLGAASINNVIGKRFIELLSVDSTNNYAMQQVQNGNAGHGDAWFAYEQTAGRGQFNRQWLSSKGQNIILSVLLEADDLALQQQFLLNMVCALTVVELFNKYTTEKIKIKWPNDIFCRDRKAAGILIENIVRGKGWQYAVAGFGININQTEFLKEVKQPVSLKQITGDIYNPVTLAKEFCGLLNKKLQLLYASHKQEILNEYNQHLYKRDEPVIFKRKNELFSAQIKSADEFGNIILYDGVLKAYRSGELEWMI